LQHRVDQCIQQQQQQQANNSNDEATFHKRNIIVIEAAVLLDAGWEDWMDGVWLVTASRETALQRLIEQRGLRREDAEQRINSQQQTRRIAEQHVPSLIQQRIMTAVIDNNGSLEDLKRNLEQALESATSWKLSSADTT
jgi:dephospho-CoA kinase